MKIIDLNGSWILKEDGTDNKYPATVPGVVHTALKDAGVIGDIFWRDEEEKQQWVAHRNWSYSRGFEVSEDILEADQLYLECLGLDTLADVFINGENILEADNMHRTWNVDIKKNLKAGTNSIEVLFKSVVPVLKEHVKNRRVHGLTYSSDFESWGSIRKMNCSFGWDWGPMAATAGIWRPIQIKAVEKAEIKDIHISQDHSQAGKAILNISTDLNKSTDSELKLKASVVFDGKEISSVESKSNTLTLEVDAPELWWPNGSGSQPLYSVTFELTDKSGTVLDKTSKRIGLRSMELVREKDQWGESFLFCVNGKRIYAKGANWIPASLFIPEINRETYYDLIKSAADVNMNMLRVWGGGIYEEGTFYDICDELGIMVWQDFTVACTSVPGYDEAFRENIKEEAADNIKRLRHHPSLALWCGNNELEQCNVGEEAWRMSWEDYSAIFDKILPEMVQLHDGERAYWPSSPHTPGENRVDFNNQDKGDSHSWNVWHGRDPFEAQRDWSTRFMSEFGFQSYPEPKTVEAFTLPEDRNLTSYVMDFHQRATNGNQKIFSYLLDWFQMPDGLNNSLWASQISQAMCIQYAVEHLRRLQPRNMGVLYWQLNDIWPAPTWASIDVFGRWKALHYYAKRFFAPVLVSILEDNDKETMSLYLSNHKLEDVSVKVNWKITTASGKLIKTGELESSAAAQSSVELASIACSEEIKEYTKRDLIFWVSCKEDGKLVSSNMSYFTKIKHLKLIDPELSIELEETAKGEFKALLSSKAPAVATRLELEGEDIRFSDNFIHLDGDKPREITFKSEMSLSEVKEKLSAVSLQETYA